MDTSGQNGEGEKLEHLSRAAAPSLSQESAEAVGASD